MACGYLSSWGTDSNLKPRTLDLGHKPEDPIGHVSDQASELEVNVGLEKSALHSFFCVPCWGCKDELKI